MDSDPSKVVEDIGQISLYQTTTNSSNTGV